jgi:hypothetical protein
MEDPAMAIAAAHVDHFIIKVVSGRGLETTVDIKIICSLKE